MILCMWGLAWANAMVMMAAVFRGADAEKNAALGAFSTVGAILRDWFCCSERFRCETPPVTFRETEGNNMSGIDDDDPDTTALADRFNDECEALADAQGRLDVCKVVAWARAHPESATYGLISDPAADEDVSIDHPDIDEDMVYFLAALRTEFMRHSRGFGLRH
jgi:hypothetical protein